MGFPPTKTTAISQRIPEKGSETVLDRLLSFIATIEINYSYSSLGISIYIMLSAFYWDSSTILLLIIFSFRDIQNKVESKLNHDPKSVYLIFSFTLFYLLSLTLSENPALSFILSSAWPSVMLIYFVLSFLVDIKKDWRLLSWSFVFFSAFVSMRFLYAYFIHPGEFPELVVNSISHPLFLVPNDLIFLSLITPFSWYLLFEERNPIVKTVCLTSIFLSFSAILAFQSRSALIVMLICIATFVFFTSRKKIVTGFVVFTVIGVITDYFLNFQMSQKLLSLPSSRIPLWSASVNLFMENPLFGNGPHVFSDYYRNYITTATFPSWVVIDYRTIPWPHNLFLEILSESGIFCFISFSSLLGYTLYKLKAVYSNPNLQIYAICLTSVFLGFSFAAMFELTLLRIWVLMFISIVLGIGHNLIVSEKGT